MIVPTQRLDCAGLRDLLDTGLAAMDPRIAAALPPAAREQLLAFVALLARWNQAFNLTAVREPVDMVPRHLLDSLAVLPWITDGPVLDLGTGAGLPGIPLALARPDLGFTLLDANGKKTRFVRQAIAELRLINCEVLQARAQTYRPAAKFATMVARAVAPLAQLCEDSGHLGAPGGRLLALKGRLPVDELAELAALAHDRPAATAHRLSVPGVDGERHLIVVPLDP